RIRIDVGRAEKGSRVSIGGKCQWSRHQDSSPPFVCSRSMYRRGVIQAMHKTSRIPERCASVDDVIDSTQTRGTGIVTGYPVLGRTLVDLDGAHRRPFGNFQPIGPPSCEPGTYFSEV